MRGFRSLCAEKVGGDNHGKMSLVFCRPPRLCLLWCTGRCLLAKLVGDGLHVAASSARVWQQRGEIMIVAI